MIIMKYFLFERFFTLLPNERYALTWLYMASFEKKIMVVDTVEKKIVSQAKTEVSFFLICSIFLLFH